MSVSDEQQFCLRWNNFQANITSQFEALRDDEDFTDVTIACEGQRIQAHKVVLSACSPFFKELFKSNPCTHPIIFMRDVEVQHIVALMEFMYAGEVNVAQAHLSAFLKTAESLKIRGLTDTSSSSSNSCKEHEEDSVLLNSQASSSKQYSSFFTKQTRPAKPQISSTSNVTSSQDIPTSPDKSCTPPLKKQCKNERNETELPRLKQLSTVNEDSISVNPFTLQCDDVNVMEVSKSPLLPKMELPDYLSDDDRDETVANFYHSTDVTELTGGMEIIPQTSNLMMKENNIESNTGTDSRKLHSLDPRPCDECGRVYSNLSNLRQHMKLIHYPTYVQCPICQKDFKTDLYLRRHMQGSHELGKFSVNEKYRSHSTPYASNSGTYKCSHKMPEQKFSVSRYHAGSVPRLQCPLRLRRRRNSDHWMAFDLNEKLKVTGPTSDINSRLRECQDNIDSGRRNRLVKLGEGIEIYEDQLRSVKWSDYRKLTRGLATILFSPAELATCSVTGQRWSRAGSGERPVKPALDRAKVQAIISYVATRFPMVEISRIKQVLAYKCKENSTALKMKAVRYYGDQTREPDRS